MSPNASPPRTPQRPWAPRAWSWAWLAALAVGGGACGRIGYGDLDALDAARAPGGPRADGSSGGTAAGEASIDQAAPRPDAPAEASSDAAPDATLAGDADGSGPVDASDASPEGTVDAPVCTANTSAVTDYCAAAPYLPQAPVIDGVVDCELPLLAVPAVGWSGGASPPDATARYAIAWRPGGVYFFVEVTDPSHVPADASESTWQGDAVEIYADSDGVYAAPPAYDNPGTRQFTVAAPPDAQSSVARAQIWYTGSVSGAAWTSTQFRAFGTVAGYVVEAFVTGPDLGLSPLALAAGGRVGVDLSIDVSFPTDQGPDAGGFGNRLGQYYLRVAAPDAGGGIPPFDVRAFCAPTLAAP